MRTDSFGSGSRRSASTGVHKYYQELAAGTVARTTKTPPVDRNGAQRWNGVYPNQGQWTWNGRGRAVTRIRALFHDPTGRRRLGTRSQCDLRNYQRTWWRHSDGQRD